MKTKMSALALALAASMSGGAFAVEIALSSDTSTALVYEDTLSVSTVALQGIMPNPDWQALVENEGALTPVYLGGDVVRDFTIPMTVDVTFSRVHWDEAAWTDTFRIGDNVISNKIAGDQSFTVRYSQGDQFDFSFTSQAPGEATPRVVTNGSNQVANFVDNANQLNFAALKVRDGVWLLGLEDGLEYEPNGADYDDLIIRVEAKLVDVPEPGSLVLMGLGAIGVGLTRMKRRQEA